MRNTIQIRFRKEIQGPEKDLVNGFLNFKETFYEENLEYTIFTEAYAEIGIPDILIIEWDKSLLKNWTYERSKLNKSDIKILHHVSTLGKIGVNIEKITSDLGYTNATIKKCITKLTDADLVEWGNNRLYIKDLDSKFIIRKIIAIEAKIKNWRCAFNQAQLNENFSSHSYVLMPNKAINDEIISTFKGRIGLLTHDNSKVIFKRKAKKNKLPGSYFSWVLNETIGSQNFNLLKY